MQGIFIENWCDAADLQLSSAPDPVLQPDQLRIAIKAAGVNFADGLIIQGKYQEKPAFPFAPGFEIAGEVTEVGSAAHNSGFQVGQAVFASVAHGGFADQAVVAATDVQPIPQGMDFVTAASFPIAYGTSHFALIDRACLCAGETLLVHGAAGGVGLTAVECGKAAGATVIATARGADRLEVVRAHGADHVIDTSDLSIPLAQQVKALTGGRGVDVVYDPVGGDLFLDSIRCTAPDGRMLVIGFAGGSVEQIPANLLLVKNLSVIGVYWGAYRTLAPQRIRASFDQLRAWYEGGLLQPHVSHTFALADAPQALMALKERKVTGKAVLVV
jgi:NADPH2:quinone reductase